MLVPLAARTLAQQEGGLCLDIHREYRFSTFNSPCVVSLRSRNNLGIWGNFDLFPVLCECEYLADVRFSAGLLNIHFQPLIRSRPILILTHTPTLTHILSLNTNSHSNPNNNTLLSPSTHLPYLLSLRYIPFLSPCTPSTTNTPAHTPTLPTLHILPTGSGASAQDAASPLAQARPTVCLMYPMFPLCLPCTLTMVTPTPTGMRTDMDMDMDTGARRFRRWEVRVSRPRLA